MCSISDHFLTGMLFFWGVNTQHLMPRIITFDICSLITLVILISSLFFRKMTRGKSNVLYLVLATVVFLSGVFDILRIYLPTKLPHDVVSSQVQIYIYNYLYFIFRNLSTPIYILFIFSVCGMWHEFNKDLLLKLTWGVPVFAIVTLIVMDIFVHKMFVITKDLEYVRGPWISYLRICAVCRSSPRCRSQDRRCGWSTWRGSGRASGWTAGFRPRPWRRRPRGSCRCSP